MTKTLISIIQETIEIIKISIDRHEKLEFDRNGVTAYSDYYDGGKS